MLLALAMGLCALPMGAIAQEGGAAARYDPDAPGDADLVALREEADRFQNENDDTHADQDGVTARWQTLEKASAGRRIGGLPHPLHGVALIKLASQERMDGSQARARDLARQGLDELRPFARFEIDSYGEGSALLGVQLIESGQMEESLPVIRDGIEQFSAFFDATAPEGRTAGQYTVKSNLEFAMSQALNRLGRRDEAVAYQRQSLESRRTGLGENDPDTIASYYGLAQMLLNAGKPVEAEAAARTAATRAIAHVDERNPSYARALEMLGLVLSRTNRRLEGADYLIRALDIKRRNGGRETLNFAYGVHNLGTILMELDRFEDARELFLEAVPGFRAAQGEQSPFAVSTSVYAGEMSFALSRPDDAVAQIEDAIAHLPKGIDEDAELVWRTYPTLILAKLDLGKTAEARALGQRFRARVAALEPGNELLAAQASLLETLADAGDAAALADGARRLLGVVEQSQFLAEDGALTFNQRLAMEIVLRACLASGDNATALEAMDLLAGSKIAQANRLAAQRLAAKDPMLAGRLREAQDLARAAAESDSKLLFAIARNEDVALAQARRDAAVQALDEARAALTRDYPQWSALRVDRRSNLGTLQASLTGDEAVMGVVPVIEGAFVLTVTRNGARLHRATSREAIAQLATRIRASLRRDDFDIDASRQLHDLLFTSANRSMLEGIGKLRVVSSGPLSAVPLSLLLEKPVARIDRNAPWLLRRYAISVSGSFAGPARADGAVAPRDARFLGIGDPVPFAVAGDVTAPAPGEPAALEATSRYFRGGGVNRDALAALPPLPNAGRELQNVARWFGPGKSTLLTGADASEAQVEAQDLSGYAVLMFATHGLVSGPTDGEAEAALVLSRPEVGSAQDGLLTVSEISALRLDADWVILSACDTAAGGTTDSSAYSGLAQAFTYAGARALLVSHWSLRDDAAAFLTVETVKRVRGGMDRATALQQAKLALIRNRTIEGAIDPAIWAPFVLVSD